VSPRFRALLIAAVAAAALLAGARAALREGRPAGDFLRYDRAATLAWRGEGHLLYDAAARRENRAWGDPENLPEMPFRYSPGLAAALSPLGALAPRHGFVAWSALCAGLVAAGVGLAAALAIRRLPEGAPAWIPAAAALLLLPHLYAENVKLGQMNCFAFGLSVAALWALDRGRDRAAGLLAAGAVLAKHIPVLLVLWFAWKRRWRAAGWSLAGVVLLAGVLPTVVFGPSTHGELLRQWWTNENHLVTETGEPEGTGIVSHPGNLPLVEGQSLRALLYRYVGPTSYVHLASQADTPGASPGTRGIAVWEAVAWDSKTVYALWGLALAATLWAAVAATAPIAGEDPAGAARRFPLEAGLVLAAVLLVSPESRAPHFQMLAPACAALAATFAAPGRRGLLWLASLGALGVLLPTQGLVGRTGADYLLAYGSMGLGTVVLFVVMAVLLRRERAAAVSAAAAAAAAGGAP